MENYPIVFVSCVNEVLASGHGTSVLGHVEAGRPEFRSSYWDVLLVLDVTGVISPLYK